MLATPNRTNNIKHHCLEDNELERLGLVLENCAEDGVCCDGWGIGRPSGQKDEISFKQRQNGKIGEQTKIFPICWEFDGNFFFPVFMIPKNCIPKASTFGNLGMSTDKSPRRSSGPNLHAPAGSDLKSWWNGLKQKPKKTQIVSDCSEWLWDQFWWPWDQKSHIPWHCQLWGHPMPHRFSSNFCLCSAWGICGQQPPAADLCLSTAFCFNILHLPSLAFISCRDRCFSNASGGPTSQSWRQIHVQAEQLQFECKACQLMPQHAPWEHLDALPVAQNNHDASLSFVRLHFHLVKERQNLQHSGWKMIQCEGWTYFPKSKNAREA